jgi:hypothetical protein
MSQEMFICGREGKYGYSGYPIPCLTLSPFFWSIVVHETWDIIIDLNNLYVLDPARAKLKRYSILQAFRK